MVWIKAAAFKIEKSGQIHKTVKIWLFIQLAQG